MFVLGVLFQQTFWRARLIIISRFIDKIKLLWLVADGPGRMYASWRVRVPEHSPRSLYRWCPHPQGEPQPHSPSPGDPVLHTIAPRPSREEPGIRLWGVPVNKRKSPLMKPQHYSPNMDWEEGRADWTEAEGQDGPLDQPSPQHM